MNIFRNPLMKFHKIGGHPVYIINSSWMSWNMFIELNKNSESIYFVFNYVKAFFLINICSYMKAWIIKYKLIFADKKIIQVLRYSYFYKKFRLQNVWAAIFHRQFSLKYTNTLKIYPLLSFFKLGTSNFQQILLK